MKAVASLILAILAAGAAHAHSYRVGNIEIVHPYIMVPAAGSRCTCADATIINHGQVTDYLVDIEFAMTGEVRLLNTATGTRNSHASLDVAIPPGTRLDLRHHDWCLFLDEIVEGLEADVGLYLGALIFRRAGTIPVEFMVEEHR
jgi:copper(I)-binding protein